MVVADRRCKQNRDKKFAAAEAVCNSYRMRWPSMETVGMEKVEVVWKW